MDDRKLDRALEAWGQAPMGSSDAVTRIVAHAERLPQASIAAPPSRRWWAWGAGGALAASVALALLWVQPMAGPDPAADVVEMASADAYASFAILYSTTVEEEMLL